MNKRLMFAVRRVVFVGLIGCAGFRGLGQQLYDLPSGGQSRVSSPENLNGVKGQGGKSNASAKGSAFTSIKAGETKTLLNVKMAGIIQRLWFTISQQNPEMMRSLRLRMYWDNCKDAAVDVPFGDFFCTALGRPVAFQSSLFANPEGRSYNCFIAMPFKTGARITLTNESHTDLDLLFFDIDFLQKKVPDQDALYFHAQWNRYQNLPLGTDVELLRKVTGKGRFLGVSVGVNLNPVYGKSWWGEGEVKMYIDGDKAYPTINGTGTEDYIGTGWMEDFFANQYEGCLLADKQKGQYAFYRFHIPDQVIFYHDFKATLQQIGGWYAGDVKQLIAAGVPLKPVSLGSKTSFTGLLEPGTDAATSVAASGDNDWFNFYRSDDYAVTAYYYLDRAAGVTSVPPPATGRPLRATPFR
jgi:hypothetical protein